MKSVNLSDAKSHLSDLVTRAAQGEVVVITRRGKPVARIVAARAPRKKVELPELQAISRGTPPQAEDGAALVRRMRDESRY